MLFIEVTYWRTKKGWTSLEKSEFLRLFPNALIPEKFQTSKLKELSITEEGLSPFRTGSKLFKRYYDACGEHNRYRFPAFDVMLTYYKKRLKPLTEIQTGFYKHHEIDYQEHYVFLRTEDGYRLLQVSLKQ